MNNLSPIESLREISNLQKELENYQKEIANKIDDIRKKCNHAWVFCYDPSGGSDSGYSCICGAWSKKI